MVYCKILNYFSLWLSSESVFQDKSIQDFFNCTFILITKFIDLFEISQQKSTIYKVDGFVKTIFPSFLDALPREEWLPEG